MSRETLEYHYEKHHRGYMNKLKSALEGTPEAEKSLEEILRTSEGSVFNHAAQVWNHSFFWNCMEPGGGGQPGGDVAHWIKESFGSFDGFREQFTAAGTAQFGSGYVWLILDEQHKMRIVSTANAGNPLTEGHTTLLTCDVWEHAYYLDHRNARGKYLDAFLTNLVNWDHMAGDLNKSV